MKKKIVYTNEDIQLGERVFNLLPRPEDLVLRPKPVRVTLTLDVDTLLFFKNHAKRLKVPYQRMIRNLLNEYRNRVTT